MPDAWNRPLSTPLSVPDEAIAAGPWETIGFSRLGSAAASVSFQNIPSTYVVFRLLSYEVNDGNTKIVGLRFNNDSAANYHHQLLHGTGATITAVRDTAATEMRIPNAGTGTTGNPLREIIIAKPLSTTQAFTIARTVQGTGAAVVVSSTAGRWTNTAALINRIDLITSAGNFAAGTLVVLQGSRW